MKPISSAILALALAGALLNTGCISLYNKTEEVGAREPRLKTDFESEHAAQLFNTTVAQKLQKPAPKDNTWIGVPFVTIYSKTRVLSENARYNEEVRKCDTNGDANVSEMEARTYWMSNK